MLVDTHAHLCDAAFDNDRADVLARARAAGVAWHVEIGEEEAQWGKARDLADANPGRVFWAAGFHPYYADQADAGLIGRIGTAAAHPRCVAIGEIGLDYYKNCAVPPDAQKKVFEKLVAEAVRLRKPMVLHCREASFESTRAQEDMLAVLKHHVARGAGLPAGVAHCFQGTIPLAREFVALGFMIGLDAPLTYPKAQSLRDLAAALPLESVVLETDSPYLPPQEFRGGRNETAHVKTVAETLARIKTIPLEEVARVTGDNAARLFRITPPANL